MAEPDINQRDHPVEVPVKTGLEPHIIQKKLSSLPALDVPKRLNGLRAILLDVNRTELPAPVMIRLLGIIANEVEPLLESYGNEIRHCYFPLPEHPYALYTKLQAVLSETVSAHVKLIQKLAESPANESGKTNLRNAILQCMEYLSQQALQAYVVYEEPPEDLWRNLHKLYTYSEEQHLESEVVEQFSNLSIRAAYARVLLLELSSPYHLMQGEAHNAYKYLKKWALAVRLDYPEAPSPASFRELAKDRFFCDLASAEPPRYGTGDISDLPANPRLLVHDEVLRIIETRMKVIALNSRSSLQLRTEWDLLHRLRESWKKRLPRSEARHNKRGTTVKAVIGLSSCHGFFTGYAPFEPELTEITVHGSDFNQSSTLSLVPEEETPWLDADTCAKLETGVIKPRSYIFDVENKENDIWEKAHSSVYRKATDLEKNAESRSSDAVFEFSLLNTSTAGEGLETKPESNIHLRVGELIAAFPHNEEDDGDPELNTVCWIYSTPDRKLRIGLHRIKGEVIPISVRSVDSLARCRDYVRAFFVRNASETMSIILPAGQFEPGNTVLCLEENRLELIKLEGLLSNTKAFARYAFSHIGTEPVNSEEIVDSLKRLLNENNR